MSRFIDLTGKKFGKLFVIGIAGKNKWNQYFWQCRCECGNLVNTYGGNLKNGTSKSCGKCKESSNKFQIMDDYVIGFTAKGEPFYFDIEDYELVKRYTWYINNKGYVVSEKCGKKFRLHRLIMNANANEEVDHRDHQLNNCRKYNLRICTHSQNMGNLIKTKKKTSSIYKGVHWDKSKGKWRSEIVVNKKRIFLGRFCNEIDGALAYNRAAIKYFGEFASINEIIDTKAS